MKGEAGEAGEAGGRHSHVHIKANTCIIINGIIAQHLLPRRLLSLLLVILLCL